MNMENSNQDVFKKMNQTHDSTIESPYKLSVKESLSFCSNHLGNSFTVNAYSKFRKNHSQMVSSNTIIYHFKTWQNAMNSHGLIAKGSFSDIDCLNAIRDARLEYGENLNSISYKKWALANNRPSLSTIISRFKKWKYAIAHAEQSIDSY